LKVDLFDVPYHLKVALFERLPLVIEGWPCKLEQAALQGKGQGMLGLNSLFALVP